MSKAAINVYDFDHTIYDGDASLDFIIYCMRSQPRTWKHFPLQALALVRYALGLATRKQIKQVAFAFLRDTTNVDTLLKSFWTTHENKIKPWYLKQKHSSDLIISASPEFLLEPIAKKLGIASPIATVMDKRTGKISGENCRADEKVKRLHKYDPSIKIAHCYSDSMSDMPLLSLADNAYIVRGHDVVALQRDSIK